MDNGKDIKVNYAECILEAIDTLKRKARPDANRISELVKRKYNVSQESIEVELDKLVESQVVIKVYYKGDICYWNAAGGKIRFGNILNSVSTSSKLQQAVRKLTGSNTQEMNNNTSNGEERTQRQQVVHVEASAADIERWLAEQHQDCNLSGDALLVALKREVDAYTLARTESGNFIIGDPSKKHSFPKKQEKTEEPKVQKTLADSDKEKMKKPRQNITPCPPADVLKLSNKCSENKQATIVVKQEDKSEDVPSRSTETEIRNILRTAVKCKSILKTPSLSAHSVTSNANGEALVSRKLISAKPKASIKPQSSKPLKTPAKNRNAPRPTMSKRKRIKKSHGPSKQQLWMNWEHDDEEKEEEEPDEEMPDEMEEEPVCDLCLRVINKKGTKEELLFCKDCPAKVHPSCLQYSEELTRRAYSCPWQCMECKTCTICTRGDSTMLICDACDKGYHMECHIPKLKTEPKGKWVCRRCLLEQGMSCDEKGEDAASFKDKYSSDAGAGASCLPTSMQSPVNFTGYPQLKYQATSGMNREVVAPIPEHNTQRDDVPDASEWSIEDVVKFFADQGYHEQAEVFREQEIDGKSLLLMKRTDVLQEMGLKLGPALKIYAQIQKLQTNGYIVY